VNVNFSTGNNPFQPSNTPKVPQTPPVQQGTTALIPPSQVIEEVNSDDELLSSINMESSPLAQRKRDNDLDENLASKVINTNVKKRRSDPS